MHPRRTTNLDESQRPAIPSLGAVSRRQEVRYLDPLVVGRRPGKAVPCKRVHKTGPGAMDPKSAISVHRVAERIERFRFPSKAPVNRYLARSIVPPAVNLLNHTHLSGDVLQRKGDGKELYHSFRGGWLAGLEEHVLHRESVCSLPGKESGCRHPRCTQIPWNLRPFRGGQRKRIGCLEMAQACSMVPALSC